MNRRKSQAPNMTPARYEFQLPIFPFTIRPCIRLILVRLDCLSVTFQGSYHTQNHRLSPIPTTVTALTQLKMSTNANLPITSLATHAIDAKSRAAARHARRAAGIPPSRVDEDNLDPSEDEDGMKLPRPTFDAELLNLMTGQMKIEDAYNPTEKLRLE
jgi:hypothetical protein